jgi:type III secretion translocon protein HrpF
MGALQVAGGGTTRFSPTAESSMPSIRAPASPMQIDALIKAAIAAIVTAERLLQQSSGLNESDQGDFAELAVPTQGKGKESKPGELSQDQIETVATLKRHAGAFGSKPDRAEIEKKANDPDTPPDLRKACKDLLNDPDLYAKLDSAKNGKTDGHISTKDVDVTSGRGEVKEFQDKGAESFTHNYVASDAPAGTPPHEINENEAKRELYRYSDNLPDKIDAEAMKKIANGTADTRKLPPQLQAAAQFYVDNPDKLKALTGEDGKTSKADMLDGFRDSIQLNEGERAALDRVSANKDKFFADGKLTREKLGEISKDPKSDPKDAQAAKILLNNPLLFGVLDNAKHGHNASPTNKVDDAKISKSDVDAVKARAESNPAAPSGPGAFKPTSAAAADPSAVNDMADGQANQPDQKKAKGGGLQDFGHFVLSTASKFFKFTSQVAGFVGSLNIPVISWAAKAGAVTARAASAGYDVADKAVTGGDVRKAARNGAAGVGMTALGAAIPGGKAFTQLGKAAKVGRVATRGGGAAGMAGVSSAVEDHQA